MPGDPRDTTSPSAMLKNIEKLVLNDILSAASKEQLTKWLVGNKTGDARLRAGLPKDWRCGDKTGSGERGTTNDVGVVWPPSGKPIVVTIYLTETSAPPEKRKAARSRRAGDRGKPRLIVEKEAPHSGASELLLPT